jgi:hypothetical protein
MFFLQVFSFLCHHYKSDLLCPRCQIMYNLVEILSIFFDHLLTVIDDYQVLIHFYLLDQVIDRCIHILIVVMRKAA